MTDTTIDRAVNQVVNTGVQLKSKQRIKAISISAELLLVMFTQGWTLPGDFARVTTTRGLPAGCKFLRGYFAPDADGGTLTLIVEHESFDEIEVGAATAVPVMQVEIRSEPIDWDVQDRMIDTEDL